MVSFVKILSRPINILFCNTISFASCVFDKGTTDPSLSDPILRSVSVPVRLVTQLNVMTGEGKTAIIFCKSLY